MTTQATPHLLIDADVAERNLSRLADYTAAHGLKLRPHTKTHKSLHFARRQVERGAAGLTTAKVGEAEVMAEVCDDLLLAYPAIDEHRRRRLGELAKGRTVRVAMDSAQGIDAMADAAAHAGSQVGVLVDLDVGFHRTGVQSPQAALELAQTAARHVSLRFDGLFFYPGHIHDPADAQEEVLRPIRERLRETIDLLEKDGLAVPIVSGGSTPTAYQSHLIPQLTEIRPGTYVFNDMNTVLGGYCTIDDCAARLVCTVVSDAVPGKVVIDAGTKTLTSDRNSIRPDDAGHGHVVEYPQAKIVRLSEEHGEVDVSHCDPRPRLGERVQVIPNHICPCVNLQDHVWLRQAGGETEPLNVDARGRLS